MKRNISFILILTMVLSLNGFCYGEELKNYKNQHNNTLTQQQFIKTVSKYFGDGLLSKHVKMLDSQDTITYLEAAEIFSEAVKESPEEKIPQNFELKGLKKEQKMDLALLEEKMKLKNSVDKLDPNQEVTLEAFDALIKKNVTVYIDEPGTYQYEEVQGYAVVDSKNVIIKDTTINGSVIITDRTKGGYTVFEKCDIKNTVVDKGAEGHLLYLEDTKVNKLNIEDNDKDNKKKVTLAKKTQVSQMENKSNTSLTLAKDSVIENLQVSSKLNVEGQGKVNNLSVNTEDLKIEANVENVSVEEDIRKTPQINGQEYLTGENRQKPEYSDLDDTYVYSEPETTSVDDNEEENYTSNAEEQYIGENDYFQVYSTHTVVDSRVNPETAFIIIAKPGYEYLVSTQSLKRNWHLNTQKLLYEDNECVEELQVSELLREAFTSKYEYAGVLERMVYDGPLRSGQEYTLKYDDRENDLEGSSISFTTFDPKDETLIKLGEVPDQHMLYNVYLGLDMTDYLQNVLEEETKFDVNIDNTSPASINFEWANKEKVYLESRQTRDMGHAKVKVIAKNSQNEKQQFDFNVIVHDIFEVERKTDENDIKYLEIKFKNGYSIDRYIIEETSSWDYENSDVEEIHFTDFKYDEDDNGMITGFSIYLKNGEDLVNIPDYYFTLQLNNLYYIHKCRTNDFEEIPLMEGSYLKIVAPREN